MKGKIVTKFQGIMTRGSNVVSSGAIFTKIIGESEFSAVI